MTQMNDDDVHAHRGWTWNSYLREKKLKVISERNVCIKENEKLPDVW